MWEALSAMTRTVGQSQPDRGLGQMHLSSGFSPVRQGQDQPAPARVLSEGYMSHGYNVVSKQSLV